MTERLRPTAEQIAAARLRLVLDRRAGRPTPAVISELAQMDVDTMSRSEATSTRSPEGRAGELRVRVSDGLDTASLTLRQRKVLEVIRDWIDRFGYPPSVREIGQAVGLTSTSSVAYQLRALERKGFLRRDLARPRAVGMVPAEPEFDPLAEPKPAYVPVLGSLGADGRIVSEESIDDEVPLPRDIVGDGELFMLKMNGDSMIDAAIEDGDWVVVRAQATVADGELVAVVVDGTPIVRTLRRRDGDDWLVPQNAAYEAFPADRGTVLGKVVTVLRSMLAT